jgi:hypothetical protein
VNESVSNRVFMVGCPRSGTTLLQSMLATHPKIQSFPETHFFSMAFPRHRIKRMLTWPALNVSGILKRFLHEINRPDLVDEYGHIGFFERDYANALTRLLDHLTIEAGKDTWVEKTPRHLLYIPEIERQIPDVKFIHVIRNGADVVASLYEATNQHPREWVKGGTPGFQGFTIDECIDRWNQDIQITANYVGKQGHFVVTYEKLVDAPLEILQKLCCSIQVDAEHLRLEDSRQYAREVIMPSEVWKSNNLKQVQKFKSKFGAIFSDTQQQYILGKLNLTLYHDLTENYDQK